jgi:hypothetical protein
MTGLDVPDHSAPPLAPARLAGAVSAALIDNTPMTPVGIGRTGRRCSGSRCGRHRDMYLLFSSGKP